MTAFNRRFQQELIVALRDYVGAAYHWLDVKDGELVMHFSMPDHAGELEGMSNDFPLRQALVHFLEGYSEEQPEYALAKRLLAVCEAPEARTLPDPWSE